MIVNAPPTPMRTMAILAIGTEFEQLDNEKQSQLSGRLAALLRANTYDPSTHTVTMPQEFAKAFHAYAEGGWPDLDLTADLGGTPVPPSLRWAVAEMVLGANPAVHMYSTGPAFARLIHDLGTDEQKQWAQVWAQKRWGATMVLSEPSVERVRRKAGASTTTASGVRLCP